MKTFDLKYFGAAVAMSAALFASQGAEAGTATNAAVTALGTVTAYDSNVIQFNASPFASGSSSLTYGNGGGTPASTATWSWTPATAKATIWNSIDAPNSPPQGDAGKLTWVSGLVGQPLLSLGKCDFGGSCGGSVSQSGTDGTASAYNFASTIAFNIFSLHYDAKELIFKFDTAITAFSISGLNNGVSNGTAYNAVPIPAAAWLVGPALAGLVGFGRKKGSTSGGLAS